MVAIIVSISKSDSPEERVVVIGGKNGAGKTTLFTAVQVCLYGNFAFGFKTAGKRYLTEIYNLINNQVRIDDNESAFIEIGFSR
ncbi:MAG: AAA family ATPase [Oscillospiraceae bacterium]